jgi:uncharacterized protein YgiM (DUF1202 family)
MSLTITNKMVLRSLLAMCLTVLACNKREEIANPNELPDINKQLRPYVTVASTKVRTGPGPQFKATGEVPSQAKVHVVGRDGDWVLIVSKRGNIPGFIELSSVKPGDGEESGPGNPTVGGKYEILANTRLHSGPGLHYPVVAEISKGTIINVVEEDKGWIKVESKRGKQPGYVEGTLAKPAADQ